MASILHSETLTDKAIWKQFVFGQELKKMIGTNFVDGV